IEHLQARTSKVQGVSFVADEEEGDSLETLPYQRLSNEINPGNFTLRCTIGNLKIHVMANVGAGINMMPKSLFEHFKLGNLKKTSLDVEMDVFRGEISLGIGRERVKFDMNGEICHSRVLLEKIYMASSIQKSKYSNPQEMEKYDSPALEQEPITTVKRA
ncbi:hypothetical protein Tco_0207456, partial [Tanacetum coccineum]